jgi:hypothetical protein
MSSNSSASARRELEVALTNRAWAQWIALGVDAVGAPDADVVDPEALIAMTAELGDLDARLRDASTDWSILHGRYANGTRLRHVVREIGTPRELIGEYVATIASAGGPRWPMGTSPRVGYRPRGKARLDSAASRARLRIRLRAAFGVSARAEILAALLASPQEGLALADLARKIRFTKPTAASAVEALALAGLLTQRSVRASQRFSLDTSVEVLPGLQPPIAQPDWVVRFGVSLRVLRFLSMPIDSRIVRSIEARRLVERESSGLVSGDLPRPDMTVLGERFDGEFESWVVRLARDLRGGG